MSREWKPGDVALLGMGMGGSVPVVAIHDRGGKWYDGNECIDPSYGPHWIRPLVVIDPEDREQVERLIVAVEDVTGRTAKTSQAADHMQAALRRLIADPKPEEPIGLGAVVEDAKGSRWIRVWGSGISRAWLGCPGDDEPDVNADYANIAAVRVLSEGVTG